MAADFPKIAFPATSHPNTRALYDYWLGKCGARQMPARRDIDPVDIPRDLLPGISLVEVVSDERRYVYRLVGTEDVEVRGNDPTGRSVIEGFFRPIAGWRPEQLRSSGVEPRTIPRSDPFQGARRSLRDSRNNFSSVVR